MRISLIMPNYNHANYLRASISAMLAQTRPADEIIIIDDASTDRSLDVIDKVVGDSRDVHIVRNRERGGAVRALNAGLSAASGDVVAFLGADDQVCPDFLARMEPYMETYPHAAFGCARVEIRNQHNIRNGERPIVRPRGHAGFVSPADMRRQLRYADNFFLGQVTLYRTARLREMGGFDEQLGSLSDGMLQRRLAVRWGYVFVPEILGIWRVHGNNYSVTSVADVNVVERMIADGRRMLASESEHLFPPGYAGLFERRLRFNSARILATRLSVDRGAAATIRAIMRGTPLDSAVLEAIARLGPLADKLATSWLAMRLRPFALSWLASEAASRAIAHLQRTLQGNRTPTPPQQ